MLSKFQIFVNNLTIYDRSQIGQEHSKRKTKKYSIFLRKLYQLRIGVDQDYSNVKEYYEKAAELGNAGALNNLVN